MVSRHGGLGGPAEATGQLSELTIADLTQQLARLGIEERIDWLANHPQAKGLVPQLSPLVLHRLAHDLGGQELAPVLPFCSDDQLRSLVDLSVWEQHDFQSETFEGWLTLNLQGGGAQLDRFLAALDPEQYLLYLVGRVRVHEIDEDELGSSYCRTTSAIEVYTPAVPHAAHDQR